MKRFTKIILALLSVTMLFFVQSITAEAVEVNGNQVNVGDTLYYEIHASGCATDIQGLDVSIYYDSAALEYVEGSISLPNIEGYVLNTKLDGEVTFNAASLDGYKFLNDCVLVSLQFKVVSDYNPYPKLNYEVRNFIDINLVDYKDIFTYDATAVSSNGGSSNNSSVTSSVKSSATSSAVSKAESSESSSSKSQSSLRSAVDTSSKENTVSDSENMSKINSELSSNGEDASNNDRSSGFDSSKSDNLNMGEYSSITIDTADTPDSADTLLTTAPIDDNSVNPAVFIIAGAAIIAVMLAVFLIIRSKNTGSHMN